MEALAGGDQGFIRGLDRPKEHNLHSVSKARWVLFFGRFNICLTFRPGSRNAKPDVLPRQFSVEETQLPPDTVHPGDWPANLGSGKGCK